MTPARSACTNIGDGLLVSVLGECIGAALSKCPDARTALSDTHQVTIDAAWLRRVVIDCQGMREGRFSDWLWRAIRADRYA